MKIIFLLIDEKNKKNPVFVDKIKMTKNRSSTGFTSSES
jgi:hypothetical protein